MEHLQRMSAEGTSPASVGDASFDPYVSWGIVAVLAVIVACDAALAMGVSAGTLLGAGCVIGCLAQLLCVRRWRKRGERLWALARAGAYGVAGVLLLVWPSPWWWVVGVMLCVLYVAARSLRKFGIMVALQFGWWWARRTSEAGVIRLRRLALEGASYLTPGRPFAARSMRHAGVYRPGLARLYLERGADQMELLMQVARAGFEKSGIRERFEFDDSLRHLKAAHAEGRGLLMIAPHLCGYALIPRVLQEIVPCSIFLRRSPSSSKHAINMAIGQAGGGHLVYVPEHTPPTEQLGIAMRILREGRGLFITPDVPRKPDEGAPVKIFDRTAYFPTGTFLMAMRTGAPIVSLLWHHEGGKYRVRCAEPYHLSPRGDRRQRLAQAVADFGRQMDAFLHEHPEMWWNWLDKRWIRILAQPAEPSPDDLTAVAYGPEAAAVAPGRVRHAERHEKIRV